MPKPLHDCEFSTERSDDGRTFFGHCREWPDLHTKPHPSALDAIDDIVAQVREKLRHVHASMNPLPNNQEATH